VQLPVMRMPALKAVGGMYGAARNRNNATHAHCVVPGCTLGEVVYPVPNCPACPAFVCPVECATGFFGAGIFCGKNTSVAAGTAAQACLGKVEIGPDNHTIVNGVRHTQNGTTLR
jgi:hypothetical protein